MDSSPFSGISNWSATFQPPRLRRRSLALTPRRAAAAISALYAGCPPCWTSAGWSAGQGQSAEHLLQPELWLSISDNQSLFFVASSY